MYSVLRLHLYIMGRYREILWTKTWKRGKAGQGGFFHTNTNLQPFYQKHQTLKLLRVANCSGSHFLVSPSALQETSPKSRYEWQPFLHKVYTQDTHYVHRNHRKLQASFERVKNKTAFSQFKKTDIISISHFTENREDSAFWKITFHNHYGSHDSRGKKNCYFTFHWK